MEHSVYNRIVVLFFQLPDDADFVLISTSSLRCPICFEFFAETPKVLPCGHTFCEGCINSLREKAVLHALLKVDFFVIHRNENT